MVNTRYIAAELRLTHWAKIIQERIKSGLSVKAFCNKEGFHENIYFYWQRKLREAACKQFTELQGDSKQTSLVPQGFTEIRVSEPSNCSQLLDAAGQGEIHFCVAGVEFTADKNYPAEQIVVLLRRLTETC